MSVSAVVLIRCEIDEITDSAEAIAALDGVSEVYSVAGEFDLVAIVRVAVHDDLARWGETAWLVRIDWPEEG